MPVLSLGTDTVESIIKMQTWIQFVGTGTLVGGVFIA